MSKKAKTVTIKPKSDMSLPDLDIRSLLDIIKENFEIAELKTFASRMIYAGEYCNMSKEEITSIFRQSVDKANGKLCDVPVRGLLLIYERYYIHVVEGSEKSIQQQIFYVYEEQDAEVEVEDVEEEEIHGDEDGTARDEGHEEFIEENEAEVAEVEPEEKPVKAVEQNLSVTTMKKRFLRMKILMLYDAITTLYFDRWYALPVSPPILVGKLDRYAPMSYHVEQLRDCLNKLKEFLPLFLSDPTKDFKSLIVMSPEMQSLPTAKLIEFLLDCQYLYSYNEYRDMIKSFNNYYYLYERVWPCEMSFTPCNLYKLKIDDTFVQPLPLQAWQVDDDMGGGGEDEQNDSELDF